jgi:hypothetical protein
MTETDRPHTSAAIARRVDESSSDVYRKQEVVGMDEPPLRVLFGAQAPGIVRGVYERRLAEWERYGGIAEAAQ